MYEFKIEDTINFIRQKKVKRLLLQFADGLKPFSTSVAKEIEGGVEDIEVIISGDSCYGACDVAFDEALCIGADGLIHYGHTPFPEAYAYAEKLGINVYFVEAFSKVESLRALEKALDLLRSIESIRKIGLTASIQHIHDLLLAQQLLEKEGYQAFVGKGSNRVKYPGQVLGCDYTAAIAVKDKVDVFLHIGGGLFHAIGLGIASQKPVILCDPYRCEAKELTREVSKIRAIRMYNVIRVTDEARHYGIVVGCKWRQRHYYSALKIKRLLEEKGKRATLIYLREVTPEALDNITEPEAFIITACPRIPIDDYDRYRRPILTVLEALIVIGALKLEEWSLCDWICNEKASCNFAFKSE
ncbi:MAG: diphthamide biosynthesis enzyme Dph2 [Candidatus Nezhaarchaeales archaeon]